jgi:hypothetical protein
VAGLAWENPNRPAASSACSGNRKTLKKGSKMDGIIRQGDVLLIPCEIPKDAVTFKRSLVFGKGNGIIIAAGEATGHHHRVRDKTARIRSKNGERFLRTGSEGATLTHEEHDPITLPPLTSFKIGTQREYDPPKPKARRAPARPSFRRVSD